MCAQCMMGATTALTAATGLRAWLAARGFAWLTPRRMRAVTIGLLVVGAVGSSVALSGTA
jgi:hypothetical protein